MIVRQNLPDVMKVEDRQIDAVNQSLATFKKRGLIYQAIGMRKHCPKCQAEDFPQMVFPTGDVNSKVMFVTDTLSAEDIANRSPLSDANGAIFRVLLEKLNINADNVYVTSLYKCSHSHEDVSTRLICATSALCVEIDTVRPQVIVGMGEEVKNILLTLMEYPTRGASLENLRRKIHEVSFNGQPYKYIQTYNVDTVVKDFAKLSGEFARDIMAGMKVSGMNK